MAISCRIKFPILSRCLAWYGVQFRPGLPYSRARKAKEGRITLNFQDQTGNIRVVAFNQNCYKIHGFFQN